MTTIEITPQLKLTIVKHLASGKPADVVATIVHLSRDRVVDIASHHGYPDVEKMARAAELIAAKIDRDAAALPEGRRLPLGQTVPAEVQPTTKPLTQPDEIRILLNTAKAHPSRRIQAAADRAFDQLDRVRTLLREDEEKHAEKRKADAEKAAARAEVERLEQQLAKAKAKLRSKPASATAPNATATDAAEIRAWAADNDVECPAFGRVPTAVREAYSQAHQDVA